jgi:hypothetical protein
VAVSPRCGHRPRQGRLSFAGRVEREVAADLLDSRRYSRPSNVLMAAAYLARLIHVNRPGAEAATGIVTAGNLSLVGHVT